MDFGISFELIMAKNFAYVSDFDTSDPVIKYCLSWISIYVATEAAEHLINSWNFHRVPGPNGCVPFQNMVDTKQTAVLDEMLIPTTPEAVRMFEENGGALTRNADFGYDPLGAIDHAFQSRHCVFQANQPLVETSSALLYMETTYHWKKLLNVFMNLQ
eukprot:TCONS_00038997-protein